MQILKASILAPASNTTGDARTSTVDPARASAQEMEDLVGNLFDSGDPAAEVPLEDQPLSFLFGGSIQNAGDPSADPFAPNNVVTLEEWLMEKPEGRYFVHLYIQKLETVRDTILIRRKEGLEAALAGRGLKASEAAAIRNKIDNLAKTIGNVNAEIDKARVLKAGQQATHEQEWMAMRDLDGDGYIGDPNDKETALIVARNPVTGREVLLDAKTRQPAVDPYLNMKYKPALIGTDSVTLITKEAAQNNVGQSKGGFDVALEIKAPPAAGFPDNSFGAQLDMVATEGFWVEKDEKTGKPARVRDPQNGGTSNYKLKAFEEVEREDGKKMIGQEPPTPEERGKYVFVRVTDLEIASEPITLGGKEQKAGDVFFTFKDRERNVIATIVVKGIEAPGSKLAIDGTKYVAASSVGLAVTDGKKADGTFNKDSSRIRPIGVDASRFESTGKILPVKPGDINALDKFYKQLGLASLYDGATGAFTGDPAAGNEEEKARSRNAGNQTLLNGFLTPQPKNLSPDVGEDKTLSDEIAKKFEWDPATHRVETQGIYLSRESKYNEYRTGIAVVGLRGNLIGTSDNDIFIVPPPDQEALRELLPIGSAETTPDKAAYGTYVRADRGRDFVYSGGGDIGVSGATFFWQEDTGQFPDETDIYLDNSANNRADDGNHAIFVRVGRQNIKKNVAIVNGEDTPHLAPDEEKTAGIRDDYYSGSATMRFTAYQNDIPGGLKDGNVAGDGQMSISQIQGAIRDMQEKIRSEVLDRDPLALAEGDADLFKDYGPLYDEWALQAEGFFSEWNFFQAESGVREETKDVYK